MTENEQILLSKLAQLQDQLTHATLKWFAIGIVTGAVMVPVAQWVVSVVGRH